MTCDRCGVELAVGMFPFCKGRQSDHGQATATVWADDIPGGLEIANGLCHADGSPRRFYSRSAIRAACAEKGLIPYHDVYQESGETRIKDARIHDEWLRSGESARQSRDRDEERGRRR